MDQGSILMTSFHLINSESPYFQIQLHWGLGLKYIFVGGHNLVHSNYTPKNFDEKTTPSCSEGLMEKINGQVRVSHSEEKGSRSPQHPQGNASPPWSDPDSEALGGAHDSALNKHSQWTDRRWMNTDIVINTEKIQNTPITLPFYSHPYCPRQPLSWSLFL